METGGLSKASMNLIEASLGLVYGLLVYVFHAADVMDERAPDELLLLLLFIGVFVGVRFAHTVRTFGARMLPGSLIAVLGFVLPVMRLYWGQASLPGALLMLTVVPISAFAMALHLSRREATDLS